MAFWSRTNIFGRTVTFGHQLHYVAIFLCGEQIQAHNIFPIVKEASLLLFEYIPRGLYGGNIYLLRVVMINVILKFKYLL